MSTLNTNAPAGSSIAWAMNRGTLFQVDGVYRYGQLVTRAETPEQAARIAMWTDEIHSIWVPAGTVLTVWNVYSGSIGGFSMKDAREFVFNQGQIQEHRGSTVGVRHSGGFARPNFYQENEQ